MTLNGAIRQLAEMRDSEYMPIMFKPLFDKVIETVSECEEPAADVAPVRHGRWEPCVERLRWRCSECGSLIDINPIDEIIGKSLPNFCPQCGALMDKGDNDGENT